MCANACICMQGHQSAPVLISHYQELQRRRLAHSWSYGATEHWPGRLGIYIKSGADSTTRGDVGDGEHFTSAQQWHLKAALHHCHLKVLHKESVVSPTWSQDTGGLPSQSINDINDFRYKYLPTNQIFLRFTVSQPHAASFPLRVSFVF